MELWAALVRDDLAGRRQWWMGLARHDVAWPSQWCTGLARHDVAWPNSNLFQQCLDNGAMLFPGPTSPDFYILLCLQRKEYRAMKPSVLVQSACLV